MSVPKSLQKMLDKNSKVSHDESDTTLIKNVSFVNERESH